MLKEQAAIYRRIEMLLDVAIVLIAFRTSYASWSQYVGLKEISSYIVILLLFFPVGAYLFTRYGLYASMRVRSLVEILSALFKTHLIGGVCLAAGLYVIEPERVSRGFLLLFLTYSFLFLAAKKIFIKIFLERIRQKGFNYRNILIVGIGKKSAQFADLIRSNAAWGLRIAGFLRENGETHADPSVVIPVLGTVKDLVQVCKNHAIDEVVFCLTKENIADIEARLDEMEEIGVTVRMTLNFYKKRRFKYEVDLFDNTIPLMTFNRKSFDADKLFVKRCMDIAGGLVGLAFTAILFPFIALAIKLNSPGPMFFSQKRVGEHGRSFTCWKFRTMYADAEQRKQELLERNEVSGAMFKLKDDPRVTCVGRFLRRTSLDELPQFWNVLRGEMSLVGTRPPTPDEVACYENWHRRRICIKPGVTGLWQVSGRNRIKDFNDIVRLDLEYIDNWSLMYDVKILLKTFSVVFAQQGSY